jgi:hypothetical protein
VDERATDDGSLSHTHASSVHAVVAAARERVTIDLRGLGSAVKAHAKTRDLRVSELARLALLDALQASGCAYATHQSDGPEATEEGSVKLTVRLPRRVAAGLATRARTCGLSQSAYLTTLIREAPAPLAVAAALRSSTEQLAVVSTDLSELLRMIRRDGGSSSTIETWLHPVLEVVQGHVRLAARLMSELRPPRDAGRRQSAKEG